MTPLYSLTDASIDVQVALETLRDILRAVRVADLSHQPPQVIEAVRRLCDALPDARMDELIALAGDAVAACETGEGI